MLDRLLPAGMYQRPLGGAGATGTTVALCCEAVSASGKSARAECTQPPCPQAGPTLCFPAQRSALTLVPAEGYNWKY